MWQAFSKTKQKAKPKALHSSFLFFSSNKRLFPKTQQWESTQILPVFEKWKDDRTWSFSFNMTEYCIMETSLKTIFSSSRKPFCVLWTLREPDWLNLHGEFVWDICLIQIPEIILQMQLNEPEDSIINKLKCICVKNSHWGSLCCSCQ